MYETFYFESISKDVSKVQLDIQQPNLNSLGIAYYSNMVYFQWKAKGGILSMLERKNGQF